METFSATWEKRRKRRCPREKKSTWVFRKNEWVCRGATDRTGMPKRDVGFHKAFQHLGETFEN